MLDFVACAPEMLIGEYGVPTPLLLHCFRPILSVSSAYSLSLPSRSFFHGLPCG